MLLVYAYGLRLRRELWSLAPSGLIVFLNPCSHSLRCGLWASAPPGLEGVRVPDGQSLPHAGKTAGGAGSSVRSGRTEPTAQAVGIGIHTKTSPEGAEEIQSRRFAIDIPGKGCIIKGDLSIFIFSERRHEMTAKMTIGVVSCLDRA